MYTLVRKTLEIYLTEKRVPTLSDIPAEITPFLSSKEAVFVTIFHEWKVIASSGRINCKKENSVYECIDNTLMCLKDPRFTLQVQDPALLSSLSIRVDRFLPSGRRVLASLGDLDPRKEWLILLSQNFGTLSVILPHMIHTDITAENLFRLACKKANLDPQKITPADYVLYGLTTTTESDF